MCCTLRCCRFLSRALAFWFLCFFLFAPRLCVPACLFHRGRLRLLRSYFNQSQGPASASAEEGTPADDGRARSMRPRANGQLRGSGFWGSHCWACPLSHSHSPRAPREKRKRDKKETWFNVSVCSERGDDDALVCPNKWFLSGDNLSFAGTKDFAEIAAAFGRGQLRDAGLPRSTRDRLVFSRSSALPGSVSRLPCHHMKARPGFRTPTFAVMRRERLFTAVQRVVLSPSNLAFAVYK